MVLSEWRWNLKWSMLHIICLVAKWHTGHRESLYKTNLRLLHWLVDSKHQWPPSGLFSCRYSSAQEGGGNNRTTYVNVENTTRHSAVYACSPPCYLCILEMLPLRNSVGRVCCKTCLKVRSFRFLSFVMGGKPRSHWLISLPAWYKGMLCKYQNIELELT